jgi:hypothetical protein
MFKVWNLGWGEHCRYLVEDEDGIRAEVTREYVQELLAARFVVYFNPGLRDMIG